MNLQIPQEGPEDLEAQEQNSKETAFILMNTNQMLKKIHVLLFIVMLAMVSCKTTQTGNSVAKENGQKNPADNSSVFIDANKQKVLGNYDEAATLFIKCLELDPADDASMYELAKIYTRQSNIETALQYAMMAAETDRENVYYLLFYGGLLQAVEDFDEAVEVFEKVVELKPNHPEYNNQLAVSYLYAGKPMEAIKVYDKLEEKAGITEEYSLKKQGIYVQENKVSKAIEEVEALISAFPLETKYYAILAEICMKHGFEEKALEAYEKIAEINENDPYVHISLADYHKNKGNNEKALEELKLGFENPNLDIDSKIQILIQYYTVNEMYDELKDEAFELAEILIDVHPDDPKSFSMYGDFLYQDQQFENARDAFRRVIELDSSKYLVWEQLLFSNSELQDNESMLDESQRAIELFPEQPIPYLFAGGALYQKKKWEDCIGTLEQGVYYVVNNNLLLAQFYAYLGDAYNQLEDHSKSDEAYEKVLMLNANHDYVLNNYAYYLALRGENLEKAAKMAKRATELKPNSSSNQDTYGWILYKMGYYDEAKTWIEKAIMNGAENNPVILEHLGDIYWKLNEKETAIEYWIRAKEAGKGSDLLDKKIEDKKLHE